MLSLADLTRAECEGLAWLRFSPLTWAWYIEPRSYEDRQGLVVPSSRTISLLTKKGLCYQTEEEPMPDGFLFTESIELTELGAELAKHC